MQIYCFGDDVNVPYTDAGDHQVAVTEDMELKEYLSVCIDPPRIRRFL